MQRNKKVAWVKGSRRRFYDDPDRIMVTLLCPRTRRFTMIICAWWLKTKSKFSRQEFEIYRNIGTLQTRKQVQLLPMTKYLSE